MKCRVRLTHAVEFVVEGESEEEIQDWLNRTTPNEALELIEDSTDYVFEHYQEEILQRCPNSTHASYNI